MSNQDDKKAPKGRSWDQITDGTTSAATMGAGSTGEVGASAERTGSTQREGAGTMQQGGQGSAGRTDDLLAGGSDDAQSDQGFQGNQQGEDGARDGRIAQDDKGSARR